MFVSLNTLVRKGDSTFAINVPDLRFSYWILKIAQKFNQPVVLQVSERVLRSEGSRFIKLLIRQANEFEVPSTVHLDHCSDLDLCKTAIEAGISSVLFDGGKLPIDENIRQTRNVVEYAVSKGAFVEGELSPIPGEEDGNSGKGAKSVSIEDTVRFVKESGIYSYAPFFGNFHGHYKTGYQGFDFEYLQSVADAVAIPLVIHGGSGIGSGDAKKILESKPGKINFSTDFKTALTTPLSGNSEPFHMNAEMEDRVLQVFENLRKIWA